jgi:hypothetical protein
MKKAALVLLWVTAAAVSAGCGSMTYKTDYIEKYGRYLDYSLGEGNWEVIASKDETAEYADFGYYYRSWKVGYTDSRGVRRTLGFDNKSGGLAGSDDKHFEAWVVSAAAEITRERLEEETAPQYIKNGGGSSLVFRMTPYAIYANRDNYRDTPYYRPVLSTSEGLRLYDYNPSWIVNGRQFYLEVSGSFADEALYSRAADAMYSKIRTLLQGDPDILLAFNLCDSKTGAVMKRTQAAYIAGKEITPEPGDLPELGRWFERALRAEYYPDWKHWDNK